MCFSNTERSPLKPTGETYQIVHFSTWKHKTKEHLRLPLVTSPSKLPSSEGPFLQIQMHSWNHSHRARMVQELSTLVSSVLEGPPFWLGSKGNPSIKLGPLQSRHTYIMASPRTSWWSFPPPTLALEQAWHATRNPESLSCLRYPASKLMELDVWELLGSMIVEKG